MTSPVSTPQPRHLRTGEFQALAHGASALRLRAAQLRRAADQYTDGSAIIAAAFVAERSADLLDQLAKRRP